MVTDTTQPNGEFVRIVFHGQILRRRVSLARLNPAHEEFGLNFNEDDSYATEKTESEIERLVEDRSAQCGGALFDVAKQIQTLPLRARYQQDQ